MPPHATAARPRALGLAAAVLLAFFAVECAPSSSSGEALAAAASSGGGSRDRLPEARRRAAEAGDELLLGVGELGSWGSAEEEPLAPAVPVEAARSCGDCSGHGICDGTSCVCFDGYGGRTCELSNGPPPPPPTLTPAPSPQPSSDDGRAHAHIIEAEEAEEAEVAEGSCPSLTAPGMSGIRCYARLHPELLPLCVGGGSCLCFIVLLGCAAMRRRKRRWENGGDGAYGATSRDSQVDSSFEDTRRSKSRSRHP